MTILSKMHESHVGYGATEYPFLREEERTIQVVKEHYLKFGTNSEGYYQEYWQLHVMVCQGKDEILKWYIAEGLADTKHEPMISDSLRWIAKHGNPLGEHEAMNLLKGYRITIRSKWGYGA